MLKKFIFINRTDQPGTYHLSHTSENVILKKKFILNSTESVMITILHLILREEKSIIET